MKINLSFEGREWFNNDKTLYQIFLVFKFKKYVVLGVFVGFSLVYVREEVIREEICKK